MSKVSSAKTPQKKKQTSKQAGQENILENTSKLLNLNEIPQSKHEN